MKAVGANDRFSSLLSLATVAIVLAALYFARGILLPLALASLVSFVLAPAVIGMQRRGCPRVVATVVVVVAFLSGVLGFGWLLLNQATSLADNIPTYKDNVKEKLGWVSEPLGNRFDRASQTVSEITNEIVEKRQKLEDPADKSAEASEEKSSQKLRQNSGDEEGRAGERETSADVQLSRAETAESTEPVEKKPEEEKEPVWVRITPSITETFENWFTPLFESLGTAGLTLVFVIFMLVFREDIRDRLIRLAGESQILTTTQALDDAATRVSRFLRMQLLINACYGVAVAIGLALIDVPNAILSGVLAGACRFLPFVGPWIAATLPISLSIIVSDGWAQPAATVILFLTLELLVNNFAEPYLYGSSIGVSAFGIIICIVFWTWLWGPVGLLLAMPLTVCLTVLARHIPSLSFLTILLSQEPALNWGARFYQRLLASDTDELDRLVDEFLRSHSKAELYEQMFLPALHRGEQDRHAGRLDESQSEMIINTIDHLAEELESEDQLDVDLVGRRSVLCIAARDQADLVVGRMLRHLLRHQGLNCEVASRDLLASELVERLQGGEWDAVVISALPPEASRHARYLCLRIHKNCASLPLIVGLWRSEQQVDRTRRRLISAGARRVTTTLPETVSAIANAFGHRYEKPQAESTQPST